MKKSVFLLCLSFSFIAVAGDLIIPMGAACPEGGHRSPHNTHWCCKDGFMLEPYTGKYDGVQATDCGCPYGGTPSETCPVECCKDGYAFGRNIPGYPNGSGKYDVLKPGCCCPEGGARSETGQCCKNHYAYNEKTKKYDLIDGSCGCPDGGTPSKKWAGEIYCCHNGFAQHHDFNQVWPKMCGCPENGVPVKTGDDNMGFNNFECCQAGGTGYRWVVDSYSDFTPEYCGCPEGGKYGARKNKWGGWDEVPYCCKNGYLYDKYETKTYSKYDPKCGCPDGGELAKDGYTCCKDKFQYNFLRKNYSSLNPELCGCPEGAKQDCSEMKKLYQEQAKYFMQTLEAKKSLGAEHKARMQRMEEINNKYTR